jgi:hypothetical protein
LDIIHVEALALADSVFILRNAASEFVGEGKKVVGEIRDEKVLVDCVHRPPSEQQRILLVGATSGFVTN